MKYFSKKNNTVKGFTLVEMMVAVAIFSLVMLVAIGAVLAIVGANKKAQSLTSVINNLNFAFEAMTRDLRTGMDYKCEGQTPGDCTDGGDFVVFTSSQYGAEVTYSLDSTTHQIVKTIDNGATISSSYLTAPEVHIDNLKFYVVDSDGITSATPNYHQSRILVVINGYAGVSVKDASGVVSIRELSKFSLQTMVSQRYLDI